ncbi:MAG TPA: pantetheine-phosphate adenylyltransferase [Gemmatimonadetes bacterium]|nr:pantetheine-phosphate adenylyltransferase [Gemmatimonadota bacterium]
MIREQPVVAIYPGSFDPITKGHEDVARRSLRIADRVVVAVAQNASQTKGNLFSVEERLEMVREVFQDDERIESCHFEGLLVDLAREMGAQFVIRGLRAVSDFEYEFQMAQMNRELWSEAETVFLTPDQRYAFLSASQVREVSRLGGDVSRFVSAPVLRRLERASEE